LRDDRETSRNTKAVGRPLSLAVIGAGYWGRKIIREALSLSKAVGSVSLHSVTDESASALEQCGREFGPLDYRLDYRSLLSDTRLDAVWIASPNQTHFEVASRLMRDGKSVLVEKPLCLTSREAYDLVGMSRQEGVVLSVGHIHRFNNAVRELRRAITTGVLGDIYYARVRWTGFLLPQKDRDVISDLASHPFDICNILFGRWPTRITCRGQAVRTPDNEEIAFIIAEYEDGLSVNIEVSWLDRQKRREVTVVGSQGIATIDCGEQVAILSLGDKVERMAISPTNILEMQMAHFVDCVRSDSTTHLLANLCPGSLGAMVVHLQEVAMKSLRDGKTTVVAPESNMALPSSEMQNTTVELFLENLVPSKANPIWDPSVADPDYSIPNDAVGQSVEARIRSSKYRTNILLTLTSSSMTPTELASAIGLDLSNLAKYVNELTRNGLVERKTPVDVRKGRIYGLTEGGRKLSQRLSPEVRVEGM